MSQKNNLDEGIFKGERKSYKITGSTPEEAKENLQDFLNKNKKYNPKASTKEPQMTGSGRYYYEVKADVKSAEDDKSITGIAKSAGRLALKGAGAFVRHMTPREKKLEANTEVGLKRKIRDFKQEYPDAEELKGPFEKDGKWISVYRYVIKSKEQAAKDEEKKQAERESKAAARASKKEAGDQRDNNIMKSLKRLSDKDKDTAEKWITQRAK